MKKRTYKWLPRFIFLMLVLVIFLIGYFIYRIPYIQAEKRNDYEDKKIEEYLKKKQSDPKKPDNKPLNQNSEELSIEYQFSDVDTNSFQGEIDSVLIIDKINLKKSVIRGNNLEDNDYNLSKYYFVTADLTTTLDGNYIIYGHSSRTYGHSFNRLDELSVGDNFYLVQNGEHYNYQVEAVDRVLRSESSPYFPDLKNRVTLVSCEKYLAKGYSEKRVIIVRAVQTGINNRDGK